jgi:putative transposase
MPWKERRTMSLKVEFVERVQKGEQIAPLCREYGVTRTTGHKWWKRFQQLGYDGLEEQSRRPKCAPLATAEEVVMGVLEARDAHPRWGPWKLARLLRRRWAEQTPSERTIARILRRAHKVRERRRRRTLSVVDRSPQLAAQAPNELWSVDFKGWWRALSGERCEPLTVRDAFSRFVFTTTLCATDGKAVRRVFEGLFRRYGLPKAIQCDNGPPFISVGARAGLSAVSAWWVSLGIAVVRSRPSCPQDNGGHERMHADISAEVQAHPASDRHAQQRRLDRWRQEFNHVRPHQALGGKTPAEVYKPTERRKPKPHSYPSDFFVRRVGTHGCFYFGADACRVGLAFRGLTVGVQMLDRFRLRVWLRDVDLGLVEMVPLVHPDCFERREPQRRVNKEKMQKSTAPQSLTVK